MSSNNLVERKYYSLYIGNLSSDVRRKELCQFLEQFGHVDQCQFFEANHRRWTCLAFVLMRTPDSINQIMSTRPHYINGRRLHLKRTLSDEFTNRIQRFITSENVLIQFKNRSTANIDQPDFNEENIRYYFETYGVILNLYLLKNNRCVIEYNDYDAVDCIILDAPHCFSSHELQVDKYYSAEQLKQIDRMLLNNHELPASGIGEDEEQNEQILHSRRYLTMRVKLLKDSILSVKISHEIQLETMQKGFSITINRRKELFEKIQQLTEQIENLRKKNDTIRRNNQMKIQLNKEIAQKYRQQVQDEKNRQSQLKNKMKMLNMHN